MYHLSRAHPLEHSRIQPTTSVAAAPLKQQTTMERYSASVPYDKESKRYKDITEAVAYHIAKDMLPLRLDNVNVKFSSLTLDLCLHFNHLSFPWLLTFLS